MNRHPDIDRTLEAFFLDGPSQMPDRLFQAVLDQVERVPQRRLTRLKLRFTDMSTTARWIAAGAAAVLVVGVGFAFKAVKINHLYLFRRIVLMMGNGFQSHVCYLKIFSITFVHNPVQTGGQAFHIGHAVILVYNHASMF